MIEDSGKALLMRILDQLNAAELHRRDDDGTAYLIVPFPPDLIEAILTYGRAPGSLTKH